MARPIAGDVRIVLLGMTGAGKSATGNTILGRDAFKVDFNPESVTQKSEKEESNKGRRIISIIDTPGLQDSKGKEKEVKAEIKKCLEMSAPGPHAFLLVIRLDERYTEEKMNTVTWIQKNFGEEAVRHTIVLLTHADSLSNRPLQDHIEDSPDIRRLIISCGGRYHTFDNEDRRNQDQVNELLLKIDTMVQNNEGKHYTKMYHQSQARLTIRDIAIASIVLIVLLLSAKESMVGWGFLFPLLVAVVVFKELASVIAIVVVLVVMMNADFRERPGLKSAEVIILPVLAVVFGVVVSKILKWAKDKVKQLLYRS